VSRRKQDAASSGEEAKAPPVVSGPARRQQPPQEVLQQQRKKHQDQLSSLTTKNYRLAKELADLRLKHREECKHVTRLTMENMNLASRCREAISHVAMLKRELAMQQKRTAQALAAQREQTKRMADSLTNSFISFSSPESMEDKNRSSDKKGNRTSVVLDEDEGIMRLVSATPSPDREAVKRPSDAKSFDDDNHRRESHSKLSTQTTTTTTSTNTATTTNTPTIGPLSPMEEPRDHSSKTAINGRTDELKENVALVEEPKNGPAKDSKPQKKHAVYSTPKKSERSTSSPFHDQSDHKFDDSTTERKGLFPFSASPQIFNKSNSKHDEKLYDEGFPSDTIGRSESYDDGKNATSKRKMNLMNSIDAFEQSFSTDFPESFTPKESNSEGSGEKTYNPFFPTPEKSKSSLSPSGQKTPNDNKSAAEQSKLSQIEYTTPPKNTNVGAMDKIDNSSEDEIRPKRPEKTIPSAARARYQRALGPRVESSSRKSRDEVDKSSSESSNPTALLRRLQQKKRLSKNMESVPKDSMAETSLPESSSIEQTSQTQKSILNIVDAFEETESGSNGVENEKKNSTMSRYQGPIKSLRRRSVKKPISYAEPPLNTKLRRGDTFFPKTGPEKQLSDGDQNQVPNLIQPAAVVSP